MPSRRVKILDRSITTTTLARSVARVGWRQTDHLTAIKRSLERLVISSKDWTRLRIRAIQFLNFFRQRSSYLGVLNYKWIVSFFLTPSFVESQNDVCCSSSLFLVSADGLVFRLLADSLVAFSLETVSLLRLRENIASALFPARSWAFDQVISYQRLTVKVHLFSKDKISATIAILTNNRLSDLVYPSFWIATSRSSL